MNIITLLPMRTIYLLRVFPPLLAANGVVNVIIYVSSTALTVYLYNAIDDGNSGVSKVFDYIF